MNFESETKKMSHKRELRKVEIFGHSPRGNKPGIKNSRLSETGGRAAQKLWSFSRILLIFDGDEILQFFYRNLLEVCREKILVSFRVPRAKKFENHWI